MNVPQWMSGIFGIAKTAAELTQKSETFLVVDPMSMGSAEEKARPVTINMSREAMDGNVDVVVYWSKTLKNLFKQSYSDEKGALHAYSKIAEDLKAIDELINNGDTDKATKESNKILETLELEGKKSELTEAIEKETTIQIDDVGFYLNAADGGVRSGFVFNDAFIERVFNPVYACNKLPSFFMDNTPRHIYSTYTKNHIAKDNHTALWYETLITNEGRINDVAVIERSSSGNNVYYVIEGCSEEHFVKLCRLVTPTYSDFNLKYENGKVSRIDADYKPFPVKRSAAVVDVDHDKLADQFVSEFKNDERDNRFIEHAVNQFAQAHGANADELDKKVRERMKQPENKEPRQYEKMEMVTNASLNVEAKKEKENKRKLIPEPNPHMQGYDSWRLDQGAQRPTEECISFFTPKIVGYNTDTATWDLVFEQGDRKDLDVDALTTYLYNAGFTYKDVLKIIDDSKKADVVLYGKKHKKASEMMNDLNLIMKNACDESAANKFVDRLEIENDEKTAIKTMLAGLYKSAAEKTSEEVHAAPEKKVEQTIDVAAEIIKNNPQKMETFAELVDECYRNDFIKKELYDSFYEMYRIALDTGTDVSWSTLAKTAETIYDQMKSKLEKSACEVPVEELKEGVKEEMDEHKVPEVIGAGIATQHVVMHPQYYNEEVGLPAMEKRLEEIEEKEHEGDSTKKD